MQNFKRNLNMMYNLKNEAVLVIKTEIVLKSFNKKTLKTFIFRK